MVPGDFRQALRALPARSQRRTELLRKGVNNGEDGEDRWSEHGLGHLLNPSDPRATIAAGSRRPGLRSCADHSASHDAASVCRRVALGQITVSAPKYSSRSERFNTGKPYAQQIKPFNFILSSHVAPFGHPIDADPERFHLIAPYESDPRKWEKLPWIDEYTEERYRISARLQALRDRSRASRAMATCCEEYEFHEEAKCADASGEPCGRQSVGLLGRRYIRIEKLHFIGKESNKLEEVEEQSISDAADVYTEYPDPRRDGWETKILPFLRRAPAQVIIDATGISRRTVQRIRNEQTKPTAEHRRLLEAFAKGGKRDL